MSEFIDEFSNSMDNLTDDFKANVNDISNNWRMRLAEMSAVHRAFFSEFAKLNNNTFNGISKSQESFVAETKNAFSTLNYIVAGSGLTLFLKSSIDAYAALSKELYLAKGITGATNEEFKQLSDNAKEVGAASIATAEDVAKLEVALAKLGYKTPDIVNATGSIVSLATGFNYTYEEVAETAGKYSKIFGIEMPEMIDIMASAFSNSSLNIKSFDSVMAQSASVLKLFGLDAKEATALAGALVDKGMPAEQAGKALNLIMNVMRDSSGALPKIMGGTVKSFDDLVAVLQKVSKEGEGFLDKMANYGNKVIMETSAKQAILTATAGVDTLISLNEKLADSAGAAKAIEEEAMQSLAGQIDLFTSSIDGAKIKLAEGFNPELKSTLNTMTKIIDLSDLGQSYSIFAIFMGNIFGLIKNFVTGAIDSFYYLYRTLVFGLGGALSELVGTFATFSTYLLKQVGNLGTRLKDAFTGNLKGEGFFDKMQTDFDKMLNKNKENWGSWIGTVKGDADGFFGGIADRMASQVIGAKALMDAIKGVKPETIPQSIKLNANNSPLNAIPFIGGALAYAQNAEKPKNSTPLKSDNLFDAKPAFVENTLPLYTAKNALLKLGLAAAEKENIVYKEQIEILKAKQKLDIESVNSEKTKFKFSDNSKAKEAELQSFELRKKEIISKSDEEISNLEKKQKLESLSIDIKRFEAESILNQASLEDTLAYLNNKENFEKTSLETRKFTAIEYNLKLSEIEQSYLQKKKDAEQKSALETLEIELSAMKLRKALPEDILEQEQKIALKKNALIKQSEAKNAQNILDINKKLDEDLTKLSNKKLDEKADANRIKLAIAIMKNPKDFDAQSDLNNNDKAKELVDLSNSEITDKKLLEAKKLEIEERYNQKSIELSKEKFKLYTSYAETAQNTVNLFSSIASNLADIEMSKYNKDYKARMKALDNEHDSKVRSAKNSNALLKRYDADYANAKKKLDEEKEAKEKEIKEKNKAYEIANVIMSTGVSIMKTWEGYAKFGVEGTILAAAQSVLLGALGATQIAKIQSIDVDDFIFDSKNNRVMNLNENDLVIGGTNLDNALGVPNNGKGSFTDNINLERKLDNLIALQRNNNEILISKNLTVINEIKNAISNKELAKKVSLGNQAINKVRY